MNMASAPIYDLARRLLAFEAVGNSSDAYLEEMVSVCEKLRVPLSKLVGVSGFGSLLARALALAKAEVPSLSVMQVKADGSLAGLVEVGQNQDRAAAGKVGIVLVAQLLGLLATFIGEPLMLRLVFDIWPEASISKIDQKNEETL
jgi:hypothetical protein